MIRRRQVEQSQDEPVRPKGFDDYELRLGDIMRGERATLGKSLLDVQRDLRIKASYIAAIENCDVAVFDTPGFVAGYVRAYARYLGMDPEETFARFCEESGFSGGVAASEERTHRTGDRKSRGPKAARVRDGAAGGFVPRDPYRPLPESIVHKINPAAIGSLVVVVALIAGLGYGGWAVLREIQRVQVAPAETTPIVLADVDPLAGALEQGAGDGAGSGLASAEEPTRARAFERLYRPQALDVPVLVARDGPISTIDPDTVGNFAEASRDATPHFLDAQSISAELVMADAAALAPEPQATPIPKVVEDPRPGVTVLAVRPSWVRVRAADGSVMFEGIMNAGDTYAVPQTEEPPTIRVGESGAVYFAVDGRTYGPAGEPGQVTRKLALAPDVLIERYAPADPTSDSDLQKVVAELEPGILAPPGE